MESGKVIVITGASGGIGAALAGELGKSGTVWCSPLGVVAAFEEQT